MKDKQRKQVIDQVLDLIKTRGNVSIDNIDTQGVTFSDLERNLIHNVEDTGVDAIVQWDCVSYDINTSTFPSSISFVDLYATDNPITIHRTFVSLSNLSDNGLPYRRMSKYETILEPRIDRQSTLSITGNFQAVVYVDDALVLSHNFPTGDENGLIVTTTSAIAIPFSENNQHRIKVIAYGKENNQPNSIILDGDIFRYVKVSTLPEVLRPFNTYATTSNIDNIRVSWEQNPVESLTGGGVEVWGKHTNLDTTFNLLEKVPHPISFYIQNSQIGQSVVNENNRFLGYVPEEGYEGQFLRVANSNYEESNLLHWEVYYDEADITCSLALDATLGVTSLDINTNISNTSLYSTSEGHTLPNNSDHTNINTDTPILFNYSSTYNLKTSSNQEVRSDTVSTSIEFRWEFESGLEAAEVQCVVYRGGTPTTHDVLATAREYTEALSPGDIASWIADPNWLQLEFKTSAALLNGDSADLRVFLNKIYVTFLDTYNNDIELHTDFIRCSYLNTYNIESIFKQENIITATSVELYNDNKEIIGYTNIDSPTTFTEGVWTKLLRRVVIQLPDAEYMKMKTTFYIIGQVATHFVYKSLSILKNSTIPIAPETEFTYKIRNYTNDVRYSEFTPTFSGKTSQEVYNLALTSDSNYISHFKANKLRAVTTSAMQHVDLNLLGMNGNVIPVTQTGISSSSADFTFTYRPLLSNCVVYDTFNNENRIINTDEDDTFPIVNTIEVAEESPARASSIWSRTLAQYTTVEGVVSDNRPPYYGFWNKLFPNFEDFHTYIHFEGSILGFNYKNYSISGSDAFYRNIFGNTDDPNGEYLFKKYENRLKFSLGMILRIRNIQTTENVVISKEDSLYSLELIDTGDSNSRTLKCTVNGLDGALVELQHTLPVRLPEIYNTDWMYVHFSANRAALSDTNETYVSVHNISNVQDSTVVNEVTEVNVVSAASDYFKWESVDVVGLGIIDTVGVSDTITMDIDTFYLTCDIINREVIDNNIVVPLIDERNPYFPSFGLKAGQDATFYAEGLTVGANEEDQEDGEVAVGGGLLTDEHVVTIDWEEPDGTMYIFRDTFTIRQDEVDSYNESQPLYTYSRMNKLYVDITSKYADIEAVRFSNDKSEWGKWKNFNNETLYPWQLLELGQPNDGTDGGLRSVYCQVITESGVTSDYWLKTNHKDSILYNPMASVGGLESQNYLEGLDGWAITMAGDAEFNDVWIRGDSKISGRIMDYAMLNSTWVKGQLPENKITASVELKREVSSASEWRGLLYYRTNLAPGYPFNGSIHVCDYPTDIQLDLYNDNIVYIPTIHQNRNYSKVVRVDMRAFQSEYPFTAGEYKNTQIVINRPEIDWAISASEDHVGVRYMPQVAVDYDKLFIGDCTTVYTVDKTTMEVIDELNFPLFMQEFSGGPPTKTYTIGGRITGMVLTYSRNKTKNLYVFFGMRADDMSPYADTGSAFAYGASSVAIVDPDTLEILQYSVLYSGSATSTLDSYDHPFWGGDIDCNGNLIVYNTSRGSYQSNLRFSILEDDGKFLLATNGRESVSYDGVQIFEDIEHKQIQEFSNVGAPLYGYHSQVNNINILGEQLFCASSPGTFLDAPWNENSYSSIFGISTLEIEDTEATWTNNSNSFYFCGKETDKCYYTSNQVNNTTSIMELSANRIQEVKLGTTLFPFSDVDDYQSLPLLTGFGKPAKYQNSIIIPYISGHQVFNTDEIETGRDKCNGTTLMKFGTFAGGLNYEGVVAQIKNETVLTCKYDGKYLWMLSVDNLDSGHREMYISRQSI